MNFRCILPMLLYLGCGAAAPQETITNVQLPADLAENQTIYKEQTVENPEILPETITLAVTEDLEDITTSSPDPTASQPTRRPKYTRKPQVSAKIPRFYSKLSYFQKPAVSSFSTNFIEDVKPGYRRYRSKCRCEKIWNCPKLQITVPRCPDEYYMCCF